MNLINAPKAEKKNHLERMLQHGTVMIYLDTRRSEVDVPTIHRNQIQLALNLSYNFRIPDFKITDTLIEVSLTFPDGKYFCILPFTAIYGMTSRFTGETVVFPEDVPAELMSQPAVKEAQATSKPTLTAISNPEAPAESLKKEEPKKKGGHLRLVK